jgi:hypothetical protein
MSFAIISIFRTSAFPILGTLAVSMSVPPCFTTMRAAPLRSGLSGRQYLAAVGASIGPRQIDAVHNRSNTRILTHHLLRLHTSINKGIVKKQTPDAAMVMAGLFWAKDWQRRPIASE